MKKVMMGNHAVSWGVSLARAEVVSAYPITPQTQIVEELSEMGKSQQHELVNRLRVLLAHLLKWQFQYCRLSEQWAEFEGKSWPCVKPASSSSSSLMKNTRSGVLVKMAMGAKFFTEMALPALQTDTRRFARRQRTWLRKVDGVQWHDPAQLEEIVARVAGFLEREDGSGGEATPISRRS